MSEECIQINQDCTVLSSFFLYLCRNEGKNPTGTHLHSVFKTYTIFIYQFVTLKTFFTFPVRYLVPSFLTRAVLCAGKEAWKRRPFLLSSQICSNYRITSICGSLAAFSLPPPPLFSSLLPLSPLPLLRFSSFICILLCSCFCLCLIFLSLAFPHVSRAFRS